MYSRFVWTDKLKVEICLKKDDWTLALHSYKQLHLNDYNFDQLFVFIINVNSTSIFM